MHSGKFVLAQPLNAIHPQQFQRCVVRYGGDYKVRRFSCWDQFLCLAFAQLTYRESLRDIEACLRSRRPQLYHLGLRGEVSRATLAETAYALDAGTNAIKFRFPNGKKTIVVRGDEDTLKGTGIDSKTSIVFGKLSFNRKGHPQRDQFKELG